MAKRTCLALVCCFVLPAVAAGQMGPKGYFANRSVDFSQARSLPFQTGDQVIFENVLLGNEHYAILMGWKRAKFEPIELRPLNTVQIPEASIIIDGSPADWAGIPPVVIDPFADMDPEFIGVPGTDIANVCLARDEENMYILMTMHNGGPVTTPGSTYVMELQQYLYQLHTPGDLSIEARLDANNNWFVSVEDRGPGYQVALYPQGYAAVGDGCIEWKARLVDIQNPPLVPYPYFPAGVPDRGIENRFIRTFAHPGPEPSPIADSDDDPMTRPMIVNFYE